MRLGIFSLTLGGGRGKLLITSTCYHISELKCLIDYCDYLYYYVSLFDTIFICYPKFGFKRETLER